MIPTPVCALVASTLPRRIEVFRSSNINGLVSISIRVVHGMARRRKNKAHRTSYWPHRKSDFRCGRAQGHEGWLVNILGPRILQEPWQIKILEIRRCRQEVGQIASRHLILSTIVRELQMRDGGAKRRLNEAVRQGNSMQGSKEWPVRARDGSEGHVKVVSRA